MHLLLCLLCPLWIYLCSCGGKPQLAPEEEAAQRAKTCYEALYRGQTDVFLCGLGHAAEMPASYRRQLSECFSLHVRQVERQHQGVSGIEVARTQADSTLHVLQVFLTLAYGDGTREEIVVPMVEDGGQWVMK